MDPRNNPELAGKVVHVGPPAEGYDRPVVGHATYRGDHTHLAGLVEPMGPTTVGEVLWPVSAEYDAETDRTRVAFTHMPHPQAVLA